MRWRRGRLRVLRGRREVDVEAFNEEGRRVSFSARGWQVRGIDLLSALLRQARQLQHTVDILDGILYVDRKGL